MGFLVVVRAVAESVRTASLNFVMSNNFSVKFKMLPFARSISGSRGFYDYRNNSKMLNIKILLKIIN